MAKIYLPTLLRDGLSYPVVSGTLQQTVDRGMILNVKLVTPATWTSLYGDASDDWELTLTYGEEGEDPTVHPLLKKGRLLRSSAGKVFSETTQSLTIVDALNNYRGLTPSIEVTRERTDLEAEMNFVSELLGFAACTLYIPNVEIRKITYRKDQPYLSALAPYLSPWDAVLYYECVTYTMEVYSRILATDIPLIGTLGPGQISTGEFGEGPERVDQVRLTYLPTFGHHDTEASSARVVARTVHGSVRDAADGSRSLIDQHFVDVYEDPETPDTPTRTDIPTGSTVSQWIHPLDEQPAISTTTEMQYADDYTRLLETTAVTSGFVNYPLVGKTHRDNVETIVETIEWAQDPDYPSRWIRTQMERVRTGLVVSSGVLMGFFGDGVPLTVATDSQIISSAPESSSFYDVSTTKISTTIESYTPVGLDMCAVNGTEVNHLRGTSKVLPPRAPIARSGISVEQRPKVEYIPPTLETASHQAPLGLDCTAIGPAYGRLLAAKVVERAAVPRVEGKIDMQELDPVRVRPAAMLGVSGAGLGYDRTYFVEGVAWVFPEIPADSSVESEILPLQSLELKTL